MIAMISGVWLELSPTQKSYLAWRTDSFQRPYKTGLWFLPITVNKLKRMGLVDISGGVVTPSELGMKYGREYTWRKPQTKGGEDDR